MADSEEIDAMTSLESMMRQSPATIRVLLRHKMDCVGCPVAPYHTPEDAAREYGVPLEDLLSELRDAAKA